MSFTEQGLEELFLTKLQDVEYEYKDGRTIERDSSEVLFKDDIRTYLKTQYASHQISDDEIGSIISKLESLSSLSLYESNLKFLNWVMSGFDLERKDSSLEPFRVYLIDFENVQNNKFVAVNQLKISGQKNRIPDVIIYINGIPFVVLEFKSAVRQEATIHDAYTQLTTRYKRDIPQLFVYNAFCIISDGANNKAGSFFAPYKFFYGWRRVQGMDKDANGMNSFYTMIQGMFDKGRLVDIIHHFLYFPDASKKDEKILCRYPQYYAAKKLHQNILEAQKPDGDGKGGTYFGATGSGKSLTMLFLARLLLKDPKLMNPTIVLITDRTDLDDQLAGLFGQSKKYLGDDRVVSIRSRSQLEEELKGRESGGVFLTTIQKFCESTDLLTERSNVICISDEAHRSQTNLEQKVVVKDGEVSIKYGFAKYLHDSLPNAVYVGFTGTPIDATLEVFGPVVDAYTMAQSVEDEITVRIVYEGRAAKMLLKNPKMQEIEEYYENCAAEGANEYQVEKSKEQIAQMSTILGDDDRLQEIAEDFVKHYETRVAEGASVLGKAMFVTSSRQIGYELYQKIIALRPKWGDVKACAEGINLTEQEQKEILPMPRIKMIMTRDKDDDETLYNLLGDKDYRKELDRQFKNEKSNFKIALVVDMWLTGFDVPALDTIYIDKFIQEHSLIQTISRVNRQYSRKVNGLEITKGKGLVVDYIGIKTKMNQALKKFSAVDKNDFEEIKFSISVVKEILQVLRELFSSFDSSKYFNGTGEEQYNCLNAAVEFVQQSKDFEHKFMQLVRRLRAAYNICCGSEDLTKEHKDWAHFFFAIKSILFKLTHGDAPDVAQMNARVREMIQEALKSDGVEEIIKIGASPKFDIFDPDYLNKVKKVKLPNTKFKLLQKLLERAISEFSKVNKISSINFTKRMAELLKKYNDRPNDVLQSEVLEGFTLEIIGLYEDLIKEYSSFQDLGIDIEEKAFYDILKMVAVKYDFDYPEDKMIVLAQEVKKVVDDQAQYPGWYERQDTKDSLKVDIILLLAKNGYPPVTHDEVYKDIFEQAENFKRNRQ